MNEQTKIGKIKRVLNSSEVHFNGSGEFCFDYYCGENLNSILRKICKIVSTSSSSSISSIDFENGVITITMSNGDSYYTQNLDARYYTKSEIDEFFQNLPEGFSGDYNDLINKPTLFSGDYNDLDNLPFIPLSLTDLTDFPTSYVGQAGKAVVVKNTEDGVEFTDLPQGFSGDYNDLINKPTIPDAQVNSDWDSNSGVSQILNKPFIPVGTLDLINDAGFITASDVPPSETTVDITSTVTVGAINAGDVVPAGTDIQELADLLLNKTFYPTFVNPSFGLSNNAGLREVGTTFTVTISFSFNRGQISGANSSGIWNPSLFQNFRAGAATSYTLNGNTSISSSASFSTTTILGSNAFYGTVTYIIGPQPLDSKNNNYSSPYPAGTSPVQGTSFDGIYPYFYYKSSSPITPSIMQSAIASGAATKVLNYSTGTISIPFAAAGEYLAVAYPASSTTKTIWYVTALSNGSIPGGVFGAATVLPCNSPTSLWSGVSYKIHVSPGLITESNPIELRN